MNTTTPVTSSPSSVYQTRKKLIMAVAAIVGLLVIYALFRYFMYVSTDNAQVQAKTVMLTPKVNGYVTKILVDENQLVKSGDALAELDTRDYQNTLSSTSGELEGVKARLVDAEKNYKRLSELVKSGAISQQQYDTAAATYRELNNRYKTMEAQLAQANLNVEYTQIRAPFDGIVAKKSAELGMLANSGMPLFGLVATDTRWITANFKETEIREIGIGKKVSIKIDAISGKSFHGHVESISPATGATFTLLPPDNATGNFTKIVQRVPVRILIDDLNLEDRISLRAGLSADVSVSIH